MLTIGATEGRLGKNLVAYEDGGRLRFRELRDGETYRHIGAASIDYPTWRMFGFQPRDHDFEFQYQMLNELAKRTHTCVIHGEVAERSRVVEHDRYVEHVYEKGGRKNERFDNDTRYWTFRADFDGLEAEDDVVDNDHYLNEMFIGALISAGLPEMAHRCNIFTSTRHGVIDPLVMRVHAHWPLSAPATMDEMKSVATHMNDKLEEAGYGRVIDEGMYTGNRIWLTSAATIIKDGRVVDINPYEHKRVHQYNPPGRGNLTLPPEWMSKAEQFRLRRYGGAYKKDGSSNTPSEFRPGNSDNAMTAHVFKFVMQTNVTHMGEVEAREACDAMIMEKIDWMAQKFEDGEHKRQERITSYEAKRDHFWRSAIAIKYGARHYGIGETDQQGDDLTVAQSKMYSDVKDFLLRSVIEAEDEGDETFSNMSITGAPKPELFLNRGPTGTGKDYTLEANIIEEQLFKAAKIDIRAPTINLTLQTAASLSEKISDVGEDPEKYISLQLGREYHCHDDMKERAREIEKFVSPRSTICKTCTHNSNNGGDCKWGSFVPPTRCGVRLGQHAHYTSQMKQIRTRDSNLMPHLLAVNESDQSSAGAQDYPTMPENGKWWRNEKGSLDWHRDRTLSISMRYDDGRGSIDVGATEDVRSLRKRFLDWLGAQEDGSPDLRSLGTLAAEMDEVIDNEKAIYWQYTCRMQDALRDGFDGGIALFRRLSLFVESATIILQAARSVKFSLDAGRDHVFGLRVKRNHIRVTIEDEMALPRQILPILYMDATANVEAVKARFGKTHKVLVYEYPVKRNPHITLTQYPDNAFSDTYLLGAETAGVHNEGEEEEETGEHKHANGTAVRRSMKRLIILVLHNAKKYKKLLLVTTKKVRTHIEKNYKLPKNVTLLHYKQTRGSNEYKDYDCMMMVGRQMPNMRELEIKAEALYMQDNDVKRIRRHDGPPKRVRQPRRVFNADTGAIDHVDVPHETHPDPRVDAVLHEEVWAECLQAIGRMRMAQRTVDTPCHIIVFGSVDTGMVIDHLRYWSEAKDGWEVLREMLDDGGVLFQPTLDLSHQLLNGLLEESGGYNTKQKAIGWQSGRTDLNDWIQWRFGYAGGTARVKVHKKHEQTVENVTRLIEEFGRCRVTKKPTRITPEKQTSD